MAKKKKGMSMEEKEELMLKLFQQVQEPYHFKEVEKMSLKAGIGNLNSNGIKQVLENLVADDKVTTERIGSSNYYWSFPEKNKKLEEEIKELQESIDQLESQIKQEKQGKNDTDERENFIDELTQIQNDLQANQKKLEKVENYGPLALSKQQDQQKQILPEYNHYKFLEAYNEQDFNKYFEIDPEWDYI